MTSEVLDCAETPFGTVYLCQRRVPGIAEVVVEYCIGDEVLMTSLAPFSERALAEEALRRHASTGPLRCLVGGLGLGYTAVAAGTDPRVGRVLTIEAMPFVVEWMQSGQLPLSEIFLESNIHEVAVGDCYERLLGPATERFDLILVDIDHAPDARLSDSSAPFYTATGQRAVSQHLAPGGILAVWSIDESEEFLGVLQSTYRHAESTGISWQDPEHPEADYENTLFFASNAAFVGSDERG